MAAIRFTFVPCSLLLVRTEAEPLNLTVLRTPDDRGCGRSGGIPRDCCHRDDEVGCPELSKFQQRECVAKATHRIRHRQCVRFTPCARGFSLNSHPPSNIRTIFGTVPDEDLSERNAGVPKKCHGWSRHWSLGVLPNDMGRNPPNPRTNREHRCRLTDMYDMNVDSALFHAKVETPLLLRASGSVRRP